MVLIDTLRIALGNAWHVNSEGFFKSLLPAVDGTPEHAKVVTTDANGVIASLALTALTVGGVVIGGDPALPSTQYSTAALQSALIPAANMAGAELVAFENTGVTPANLQLDTVANIVAAIPGAYVGQSYLLRIRNSSSGANTATITTNTGLTLHGTMTIAQNVTRDFIVKLTSLTAVDIYSMGVSAAAA